MCTDLDVDACQWSNTYGVRRVGLLHKFHLFFSRVVLRLFGFQLLLCMFKVSILVEAFRRAVRVANGHPLQSYRGGTLHEIK
jgi:hypothetical protein